jgi:hypothetical protein
MNQVEIGIGPDPLQPYLVLEAARVDNHELLAQVVEERPDWRGRFRRIGLREGSAARQQQNKSRRTKSPRPATMPQRLYNVKVRGEDRMAMRWDSMRTGWEFSILITV